jgi:tRNA-specific 2-thiouridylase
MAQARRVAAILGIPFYALDARELFRQTVVKTFVDGYMQGETPNPCVVCNREIRWGFLLDQALASGAEFLATGHYARLNRTHDGEVELLKAVDTNKDQTYVLSSLSQYQLAHTIFPLGELQKAEVRQIARNYGLPVAERPESQDLCFLGTGDYRDFLIRHHPDTAKPGPIFDRSGNLMGEHKGLAFYTIGQRKGLGIAVQNPLYVLEKRIEYNCLIVGPATELGTKGIQIIGINWISGRAPSAPFRAEVKIRYKANMAWAEIFLDGNDNGQILFDRPLRDITPGQLAVIYQGDQVVGSGWIGANIAPRS